MRGHTDPLKESQLNDRGTTAVPSSLKRTRPELDSGEWRSLEQWSAQQEPVEAYRVGATAVPSSLERTRPELESGESATGGLASQARRPPQPEGQPEARLPARGALQEERTPAKRLRESVFMVSPFAALMLDAVLRFPGDAAKVAEALSHEALSSKARLGEAHGAPDPASSVFGARPAPDPTLTPFARPAQPAVAAGVALPAGSSRSDSSRAMMPRLPLSRRDGRWDKDEIARLLEAVSKYGNQWTVVSLLVASRDPMQCRLYVRDHGDRDGIKVATEPEEKMTFRDQEPSLCGVAEGYELDALVGKFVWHRANDRDPDRTRNPFLMSIVQDISHFSLLIEYDDGDRLWEPACSVEVQQLEGEKVTWINCARLAFADATVGKRARCQWDDGVYAGTVSEIKRELCVFVARYNTPSHHKGATLTRAIDTTLIPLCDVLISRKQMYSG